MGRRATTNDNTNQSKKRVWDFDEYMTEHEAVEYSVDVGYPLTLSRLRASRMEWPTCVGPRFEKVGRNVFYTPRYLDEFLDSIRPRVIDPAERMAAS